MSKKNNKTKNWREEFDEIVNKIFVANTEHQAFTTEQWNEEIAPLFRKLLNLIKKAKQVGYEKVKKEFCSCRGRIRQGETDRGYVGECGCCKRIIADHIINKLKPKSKTLKKGSDKKCQ